MSALVEYTNGRSDWVEHRFGTIESRLTEARTANGFASFNSTAGRVLVNPSEVVRVVEAPEPPEPDPGDPPPTP